MGTLSTDFTLIKPGALHRANGGYLIVDADKLLHQPFAWQALKRALRSARRLRIESIGAALGLRQTTSLEPEPIPLRREGGALSAIAMLYYLLQGLRSRSSRAVQGVGRFHRGHAARRGQRNGLCATDRHATHRDELRTWTARPLRAIIE